MKNSPIALMGLLITTLLIGFLFVKMYVEKSPETQQNKIETYREDIQKAEDVKKLLESRSLSD